MSRARRFAFVGNRRFVLEEMIRRGCELSLVAIAQGSHLERDFNAGTLPRSIHATVVGSRQALVDLLQQCPSYDVLVSNGCPFILPVGELPEAIYVNIHPSVLPDLRGVDPVIGSILFSRDAGATCHLMDAGIDTGDIVSQVRILFSEDLDVTTLYQLSFVAEQEAFTEALAREFEVARPQIECGNEIQYRRRDEDQVITFSESVEMILRKVRAFNNRSIGCRFWVDGQEYRVFAAEAMENSFLQQLSRNFDPGEVIFSYENSIVFRVGQDVLRFRDIERRGSEPIRKGARLF